jgi:hypothetical protein
MAVDVLLEIVSAQLPPAPRGCSPDKAGNELEVPLGGVVAGEFESLSANSE